MYNIRIMFTWQVYTLLHSLSLRSVLFRCACVLRLNCVFVWKAERQLNWNETINSAPLTAANTYTLRHKYTRFHTHEIRRTCSYDIFPLFFCSTFKSVASCTNTNNIHMCELPYILTPAIVVRFCCFFFVFCFSMCECCIFEYVCFAACA